MSEQITETKKFDQDLVEQFITESFEALADIDSLFVLLEQNPEDHSLIDSIFRPIHSIKGNSSFFDLDNIKTFSHAMENLLQELRSGKCHVSKRIIDCLLAGVDRLRLMFDGLVEGKTKAGLTAMEQKMCEEFIELAQQTEINSHELAAQLQEHMAALLAMELPPEAVSAIQETKTIVTALLQEFSLAEAVVEGNTGETSEFNIGDTILSREFGIIRGFVKDIQEAQKDEQRCEEFVSTLANLKTEAGKSETPALLSSIATLEDEFVTIHQSNIGFDDLLSELIKERLAEVIKEIGKEAKATPLAVAEQAPAETTAKQTKPESTAAASSPTQSSGKAQVGSGKQGARTLRVAEDKVDHFMSYVGELIVSREIFAQIEHKLDAYTEVKDVANEFKNANIAFNELSNSLQESLMAVRRVPLSQATQKLPRIVRDLSSSFGKQIEFVMDVEGLEVDKSLLEGIENPLVHMVRNSLDHGIELPEQRAAAGKPETGHIWVSAEKDEGSFHLSIRDDGAGLDTNRLKEKAVAKGLIDQYTADNMS
ncbi:MAG: Hpt domain-containing protein, partial [Planctomycetes bacterium]|nr:Hpt domain-containing protein [Planctomycetota bacterium]